MKHRVLIVDDYPDAAEIACTLLAILGHECRAVSCGKDALAEALVFVPDVALLDIGLPDINGYDLARSLRALLAGRPLYIAAITGWGNATDRIRALECGFDQHVLKPADASKLRDILVCADRIGERPIRTR
jgi:DNA-binding response OmpR family regulator